MSNIMRKPVLLHLCCSQSERSNSVIIQYLFRIEGMLKAFIFWGMGDVFGTNQPIRRFQNSLGRR